jgi:hypothetical protein
VLWGVRSRLLDQDFDLKRSCASSISAPPAVLFPGYKTAANHLKRQHDRGSGVVTKARRFKQCVIASWLDSQLRKYVGLCLIDRQDVPAGGGDAQLEAWKRCLQTCEYGWSMVLSGVSGFYAG